MTPVPYILKAAQPLFNNGTSNGIILVMGILLIETFHIIAMHSIAYTAHTLHSTYYYYIAYTDVTDAYFCKNVSFCIDLMAP